jgi:ubiquinone/menaquinone biosynthesis C-methylase UbiE
MPVWDALFLEKENRWENIHDRVVEFADSMHARGCLRILDLGCGSGRHTAYLAAEGFEVWGMDNSPNGLAFTRERLEKASLTADLRLADMEHLPYQDHFFDGVISIHVIFHNTRAGLERTLAEIDRVLRPGGRALVTFLSPRGYRYGAGDEIEKDTFITDSGVDKGERHHFSTLAELGEILARFIVLNVNLEESFPDNPSNRSSHWEVLLEKAAED